VDVYTAEPMPGRLFGLHFGMGIPMRDRDTAVRPDKPHLAENRSGYHFIHGVRLRGHGQPDGRPGSPPVRDHSKASRVEGNVEPELTCVAEHPAHLQLTGGGLRARLVDHDPPLHGRGRPGDEGPFRARGVEKGRQRVTEDGRGRRLGVLPKGRPRAPGHGIRARHPRQDHRGARRGIRSARKHPVQSRLLHLREGRLRRGGR
jgi:hypothetical protein